MMPLQTLSLWSVLVRADDDGFECSTGEKETRAQVPLGLPELQAQEVKGFKPIN